MRELDSASGRDLARISRFFGEHEEPGSADRAGTRERAITSRNNYRLARPRGPSSRLFLRLGIPTTKNTLPGKLFSRYETARGRNCRKERKKERRERETAFRIKSSKYTPKSAQRLISRALYNNFLAIDLNRINIKRETREFVIFIKCIICIFLGRIKRYIKYVSGDYLGSDFFQTLFKSNYKYK